jgi:hypothetical protein
MSTQRSLYPPLAQKQDDFVKTAWRKEVLGQQLDPFNRRPVSSPTSRFATSAGLIFLTHPCNAFQKPPSRLRKQDNETD